MFYIVVSIASLWAARICADHFDDVVFIDPEAWIATDEGRTTSFEKSFGVRSEKSEGTHNRARVMQYNALHGMYL